MNMKKLLIITSIVELLLGIFLILLPVNVIVLLFGVDPGRDLIMVSRLTGIAYLCFGISCFPSKATEGNLYGSNAYRSMFLYNFLAAVYLGYAKFALGYDGIILLPAVILHSIITLYFLYLSIKKNN